MKRPKKSKEFIELDEIRKLLAVKLTLRINRTGIYFYIKQHKFPLPVGLGRPRKWLRAEVLQWIENQTKKD